MINQVILKGAPFYNVVRSAIEPFPQECIGYLFGYEEGSNIVVCNAYSIQTAERGNTWVSTKKRTDKRLRGLEKLFSNGKKVTLLGGYHSHPHDKKDPTDNDLSSGDMRCILREFREGFPRSEWLEMIMKIERKKHQEEQPEALLVREYPRKLRIIARPEPPQSYAISIGAYYMGLSCRPRELVVRTSTDVKDINYTGELK